MSLLELKLSRNDVPQADPSDAQLTSTAPFAFPQIVEAASLGLGVGRHDEVELSFDDVPDATELEQTFRGS